MNKIPALLLFLYAWIGLVTSTPTTTTSSNGHRQLFPLPQDFYNGRCHPCLARKEYFVQVFGANTPDWLQIRSAMEQASRDTKIELRFQLFEVTPDGVLAMAQAVRDTIVADQQDTYSIHHQAIIVTIPETDTTEDLEQAIATALESGIPVFGYGSGYRKAPELGTLGYVAQDEFVAGAVVAEELMELVNEKVAKRFNVPLERRQRHLLQQVNWTHAERALFVTASTGNMDSRVQERYEGLQYAFGHYPNSIASNTSISSIDIQIDVELSGAVLRGSVTSTSISSDLDLQQLTPSQILEGCPYDILILDGDDTTDQVMEALEQSACNETLVAVFSDFVTTQKTRERLLEHSIAFAAKPQIYLQSVFVVLMASVYTATGKKLALPMDSEAVFLSGPQIVAVNERRNRLPEDSITNCEAYAFPICNPDSTDAENTNVDPFPSPVLANPPALLADRRVCNEQGCIARPTIRIAGVLHGTSTSLFWKPIYQSAHQTAIDMGVSLEMEPMDPQETREIFYAKMAFRIRSFCESGVDGIMVTIPDAALLDAIRFCQDLRVPVVSINSGAEFSEQLGLMAHIGQMEYNAGYGGGQRLISEGMKEGYCVIHNLGNTALLDRCRGLADAIADAEGVVYHGMVEVSGDDVTQFKINVEAAVQEGSGLADGPWEGLGFLTTTTSIVDAALSVIDPHPGSILGTFDVGERIYGPLGEGRLKFGIDQQPLLQGIMPVYLLTYSAYTKQALESKNVETGPHFLDAEPTKDQEVCENNYFAVCKEIPEEEMNALPKGIKGIGYFMVALTLFTCVLCVAWTLYYRASSELVRVSQPPFLIALVGGIAISSLSILFMSVETEYPTIKSEFTGLLTDEENPDIGKANASCMAVYWLQGIGNAIAFVSLFSKIWKIQMIYKAGERFRRIEVGMKDILPYASVLMVVVLGILIAWQVVDPFVWTRTVELENDDGLALESYGECSSDKGWHFLVSLLCFQLVYLMYALVLCWQTKNIPSDFAESEWVSLCVICIFQVSILALPIAAMVRDDSTAFYFVRACAVFLQNFTVLCLMFIPKMWRVAQGQDKLTGGVRKSSLESRSYMSDDNLQRQSGDDGSGPFGKSTTNNGGQSGAFSATPSKEFRKSTSNAPSGAFSVTPSREFGPLGRVREENDHTSVTQAPTSRASETTMTLDPTEPIEAQVSVAQPRPTSGAQEQATQEGATPDRDAADP